MADHKTIDVLLVEDDPGDVLMTREAFEDHKVTNRLSVVSDGVSALQFLRKEGEHAGAPTPDLILLDINMPRMDGHALSRQLRDDGNLVPVIGATANATAEERERCLASGMQGYLSKPIDIARLRKALTALRQGDPA